MIKRLNSWGVPDGWRMCVLCGRTEPCISEEGPNPVERIDATMEESMAAYHQSATKNRKLSELLAESERQEREKALEELAAEGQRLGLYDEGKVLVDRALLEDCYKILEFACERDCFGDCGEDWADEMMEYDVRKKLEAILKEGKSGV